MSKNVEWVHAQIIAYCKVNRLVGASDVTGRCTALFRKPATKYLVQMMDAHEIMPCRKSKIFGKFGG